MYHLSHLLARKGEAQTPQSRHVVKPSLILRAESWQQHDRFWSWCRLSAPIWRVSGDSRCFTPGVSADAVKNPAAAIAPTAEDWATTTADGQAAAGFRKQHKVINTTTIKLRCWLPHPLFLSEKQLPKDQSKIPCLAMRQFGEGPSAQQEKRHWTVVSLRGDSMFG